MVAAKVTTAGRTASLRILTQGYTVAGPATLLLVNETHDFAGDPAFVTDLGLGEVVATGYARQQLDFEGVSTGGDGTVTQQSKPQSFGLVGGAVDATVSGCYVFEDSGDDSTSPVTACLMFVDPKTTDGTELIVRPIIWQWNVTVL